MIFDNNVLIDGLGPFQGVEDLMVTMARMPPTPVTSSSYDSSVMIQELERVQDIFLPSTQALTFSRDLGLMVRSGYRCRNPHDPSLQAYLRGSASPGAASDTALQTTSLVGVSGSGKSTILKRAVLQFPNRVVTHKELPGLLGEQRQLIYLIVETPASGMLDDLAYAMMQALDDALQTQYFKDDLERRNMDAVTAFERWLHFARLHHVGVVLFDEFQNLLKLTPKKERLRKAAASSSQYKHLTIVQDKVLQNVLGIANHWRIPLVFCMTPDGRALFDQRFAVGQRMTGRGETNLDLPSSSEDQHFANTFLPFLARYQYLPEQIELDEEWRKVIYANTAYIRRLVVQCWITAQRIAIDRGERRLTKEHFIQASLAKFRGLRPAVDALVRRNPEAIRTYHDLVAFSSAL